MYTDFVIYQFARNIIRGGLCNIIVHTEIEFKKFIFRYQYLVEIYSVSAEKIISDAFSYSENV
jgi:hypothetical protein